MCMRGDTVPLVIKGRRVEIDRCIAPIVKALNDAGIETAESCCGHGEVEGHILAYQDGKHRLFVVYELGEKSRLAYEEKYRRYAEISEEKTKALKRRENES